MSAVQQERPVPRSDGVADSRITRVESKRPWGLADLRELIEHRELFYFLAWRDIKVRYKQTAFGASWAVIQPFMTMVVFSLFFGHLAGVPSDGVPYPLFAYAALLPWTFFANSLAAAANSLVVTPDLITKIYLPRIIIPASAVVAGLVDFVIAFLVFLGICAYYGALPGVQVVFLLPLLAMTVVATLGVGFWLAALNVAYRDVRYAMGFLVQFWLFATPVAFPSSLLHEPWRTLLGLNPMAGVVEGFRWALLDTNNHSLSLILVSVGSALVLLVTGYAYFRRVEDGFADII